MDDRQPFQATLGLKAPWFVSDVKLNKSIRDRLDGIVESVRRKVTSGYAEGLNNKIRTAFRCACGSRPKSIGTP